MSASVIVDIEVHDPAGFKPYAAHAGHAAPEYQELKAIRQAASTTRAIVVPA